MQALSGMAEYQNLLLKLENGWKQIPSSIRKEGRTPKRVRMDVGTVLLFLKFRMFSEQPTI